MNDVALMNKANMHCGNDPSPITSAREAAEALFAPKPEDERQPLSDPGEPVAARKPRVLPPASIRQETVDVTPAPKHLATPVEIPAKSSRLAPWPPHSLPIVRARKPSSRSRW